VIPQRQRRARIRAEKHGVLLDDVQWAELVVGDGRHVRDELRYVGPDADFDAGAEGEGDPADVFGGRAELETGFDADTEEGGEDDARALDGYGEELEVASVAGGVNS
jgi:hypothetical protein